jgi:hypothetical protein
MRLPYEPHWMVPEISVAARVARGASSIFFSPWIRLIRRRAGRCGIRSNDFLAGMHDSGEMTEQFLLRLIKRLPNGITEVYFHPSTRHSPEVEAGLPGYKTEEEYKALTSPAVREEFDRAGVGRITFSDI